jgi:cysteinyl-tRNA synthetase
VLHLHDTALSRSVELVPRDPGRFSLYVCGPTVYDVPHIGHGRSYLVYDVLVRYLEWIGLAVDHVRNITDIDDKIIERAAESGRDAAEVAREFEQSFYDACDALGIKRPTHDPHATAYVDRMLDLIGALVERDLAYETADGVYLDTERVPGYGLLAQQPLEDLRAGARVESVEEKRSPLDFVLWKKAKPAKRAEPSWSSKWGEGRPGWHTECVVMSLDLLGDGFDLHAGGLDLKFPHHENERAQAVALGHTFARHWMHHAFVEVGGVKMSKSLKNFTSLVDLLDRHDARAYRLLVLRSHYRSPMEVTPDTIEDAEKGLARLDEFARKFGPGGRPDAAALDQFRALMDDDLNTPGVVALLFDLVRRANADGDEGAAAAVHEIAGALGLGLHAADDAVDDATAALVRARDEARAARDFARADAIRDELAGQGWVVKDTPEGTQVHR